MTARNILMAAAGKSNIEYVGGAIDFFGTSTANRSLSLTSLTGGIGTQPQAGDLVIAFYIYASDNINPDMAITGYTQYFEAYVNNTNASGTDVDSYIGYKYMTATPDTSITVSTFQSLGSGTSGAIGVQVWRNAKASSPLTGIVNNPKTTSLLADPPAITPTIDGSYVIAVGAGGSTGSGTPAYSSSDLTNFLSISGGSTKDGVLGFGYKKWTGGQIDPSQFTISRTDSSLYSSIGYSFILLPA